ncbi:hypothetical protein ACQWG0_24825, partial [Salmonella enterica subsp. enterica serovar Infantis]
AFRRSFRAVLWLAQCFIDLVLCFVGFFVLAFFFWFFFCGVLWSEVCFFFGGLCWVFFFFIVCFGGGFPAGAGGY